MASESAIASLFTWTDAGGAEQQLDVDVVMNLEDSRIAEPTDHVVEDGSVITDHVVVRPEELSLELVVSQTPILNSQFSFVQRGTSLQVQRQTMSPETYPLEVPPSRFVPGGFLFLSQGTRQVVTAVADTTLSALGIGAGGIGAVQLSGHKTEVITEEASAQVYQAEETADRINDVHDRLVEILNDSLPVTVAFGGKIYSNYLLVETTLTRAAGKAGSGSFSVRLRAFRTVTGQAVQLPAPVDFRVKPSENKGNKKTDTTSEQEKTKMRSFAAKAVDGGSAYIGKLFGG